MANIVAITSCPTGIAHTFMAAEGLEQGAKSARSKARKGPYKHLLTGVSYMIPFVVAGGILIALAFAIGGYRIAFYDTSDISVLTTGFLANPAQSIGAALFVIGAKAGFLLFVPVLAGFIAYSIADRPGIAPGMIGGVLAGITGSGFLGGIIAGFLAGYLVYWLNRSIRLPRNLAGIMPVLVLPVLGSLIVGLLIILAVGTPRHL